MPVFTDRALLLRRSPFGESSLVAHVLTRRHGRVHVLAKGAHRTTSRYFGVLDFFDTLELEWSERRGAELALLRRGDVQRRRRPTSDLGAYTAALTVTELAELAARPDQAEPDLFDGAERALERLARGGVPSARTLVEFELAFLQNLGLAPALDRCAACGRPADPVTRDGSRAAFSAGAGGRLCLPCAEEARASGRRVGTLPVDVLAAARAIAPGGDRASLPEPDERQLERIRDFVGRFLDYHLETRPRTHREFLAVPNRNAPAPEDAPSRAKP